MATFYHPAGNRGAATTILTIAPLESYDVSREKEPLQSQDETPGGDLSVYDLGVAIQYLELKINDLETANRNSLISFIENTVNWAVEAFDFDDDQGIPYDSCHLVSGSHDFKLKGPGRYADVLELRVNP